MSSKHVKIPVDLAIEMVRRWNETYHWIPISGAFAAISVAFSTGANSLTAPVGLQTTPLPRALVY